MLNYKDLVLTPIYLGFFYLVAYAVRGRFTNAYTRPYFVPALTVKFIGAIALGLVYEYYYGGGDTSGYFYHASLIHQAFSDSFPVGMKLLLTSGGIYDPQTVQYTVSMAWYYAGSPEYLLARFAAVMGLLCFNTYTIIALFFAITSFTGGWAMYITFVKIRPQLYKQLAITTFFVPSLFFWGSGLMKDSICLGALGWLLYAFYRGTIQRQRMVSMLMTGMFAAYILFRIKVYILLAFLPPALLWIFNENSQQIKNQALRILLKPLFLVLGVGIALYAATTLTAGNSSYDVDKIGERSKITADYLYGVSVATEGSAYKLGEQDGTIGSMVKLAPQAIVVSLFRPFLWEVRNPVMLLSSLESLFMLGFTLRILFRAGVGRTLGLVVRTPVLTLCFVFALVFAATVGIVSNNFGTLVRYKIPLLPFYMAGLMITQSLSTAKAPARAKARRLAPAGG